MLTDQHIDALRSADRALTDATFRLAMAVDFAASVLPAWHLPTDVLKALDDYRESVAQMWPFFTPSEFVQRPTPPAPEAIAAVLAEPENGWIDPTCSIPGCWQATQFTDGAKSYCWDHHPSYAMPTGPTQDQEPEQATPEPEETCSYDGCINPRKPGYDWCEEHIDAGLDEELRILTPELRCVCVGCQNPATVQIGEFWYCAEHQADPIPF